MRILVLILVLWHSLFASPKDIDAISKTLARALFNLDAQQMQEQITTYMHADANINKISIYDVLDDAHFISCIRLHGKIECQKDQAFASQKLSNDVEKQSTPIEYDGETIGRLELYLLPNSAVALSAEERAWIKAHGTITVHNEKNWPPFNFVKDGKATGYSIDYISLLAQKVGLELSFVQGEWDELLQKVYDKKLDVMLNIVRTTEREKKLLYVDTYATNVTTIITHSKRGDIVDMESLEGKKISVIKGFYYENLLKEKYPQIEIVYAKDMLEALKMVMYSKVDATLGKSSIINYIINENGLSKLRYANELSVGDQEADKLNIAVRDDFVLLQSILKKAMRSLTQEEKNSLKQKWLASDIEVATNEYKQISITDILPIKEIVSGVVLFLVLFYLFYRYKLRDSQGDVAIKGFVFWVVLLFLSAALLITAVSIQNLEIRQKQESKAYLKSILNSTYKTVKMVLETHFHQIDRFVAENAYFNLDAYIKKMHIHDTELELYVLNEQRQIITSVGESAKISQEVFETLLLDERKDRWVFMPYKKDSVKLEKIILIKPIKEKQEILGYLAKAIDPKAQFEKLLLIGQIGKTGETYAVNEQLQLISKSRFEGDFNGYDLASEHFSSLDVTVDTFATNELFSKKTASSNVEGYSDYRGEQVYGSWIYDDQMKIGFVTEMDEKELMEAFESTRKIIFMIVVSIVLFTLFLTALIVWISAKSKKSLQKANKELAALIRSFDKNVIASKTDKNGVITYVSDAFCLISGYDKEELLGKTHSIVRHSDMPKDLFESMWETLKSNQVWKGEIKNRKKDGGFYWVEAIITPECDDEGLCGYSAIRQDITAKKEVEELSRSLEQKVLERTKELDDEKTFVNSVMNSQSSLVIATDGEVLRSSNQAFRDFFEVESEQEFIERYGNCICDTFVEEKGYISKKVASEKWVDYVKNHSTENNRVKIIQNEQEYIFTVSADSFEFQGATLKTAVFNDITELENVRRNIELILSNILLPVLITSVKDRTILYANKYALKQYEATKEELIGKSIDTIYTKENQKEEILAQIEQKGYVENLEQRYKTLQGREFPALLSVKPLVYDNHEAIIGMIVDITKQKQIEAQIKAANKHVRSSIDYASLIQHSLIPDDNIFYNYFSEFFALWHPKDIVGGDIYLFEELRGSDECLLMVIDCTGHGVPGAFVTMLVKAIERQVVGKINSDPTIDVSPAWILSYFNKTMKKLLGQESEESISNAGFDGGVLYYNKKQKVVKFSGAQTPLFYVDNGKMSVIKSDKHSLRY